MLSEFDRIRKFFAPLSASYPGAFGLKDDCALLGKANYVVTTDTMIESVHFIGDEPAAMIAKKLLRCNLSDLASKGALPLYYTLNITSTSAQDDAWFAQFTNGLAEDQAIYGLTLIGGDSTYAEKGLLSLTVTMFGTLADPTMAPIRAGAKAGDLLCVTGLIGEAAMGLRVANHTLQASVQSQKAWLDAYRLPQPRTQFGQHMNGLWHACLDVSDGLVQDAGHLAAASSLAIDIDALKIPISAATRQLLSDGQIKLEDVVAGGDDYELLFSLPPTRLQQVQEIARTLALPVSVIGVCRQGSGVRLLDEQGGQMQLSRMGYQHGH